MNGIPAARSNFFGKDAFTPFIGRVEDVNDPKHGGRVKVRCIGWHPKSKKSSKDGLEDGLSTDDLPWARVGLPTTMAQQGRIGGKHGLLNGCWVFGFFLDGEEAQDPMILSSINFTPKSTDTDDRKPLRGEDGKDAEEDDAFGLHNPSTKTTPGNAALHTDAEKSKGYGDENDPSGHGWNADYDATKCGGKAPLRSRAARERQDTENTAETPTGQRTQMMNADGRCGSVKHARDDIRLLIKRYLPQADSRYVYNDVVWNNYTGSYLNLNGILAQLAIAICSELKQPINAGKSQENRELRLEKSAKIDSKPDRDGVDRDEIEDKQSTKGDIFNSRMQTSLIDTLCDIMMKMLQAMNNGGETGAGGNATSPGATPITPIRDAGATCITDTILRNVEVILEATIIICLDAADEESEDYDPQKNPLFSAALGFLSALFGAMKFPRIDYYAKVSGFFNKKQDDSQDAANKDKAGCRMDRVYDTELGSLRSIAGFSSAAGGSTGGGQGSGGGLTDFDIGFGGKDRDDLSDPTNLLCEDAYTQPIPDTGEGTAGEGGTGGGGGPGDVNCNNTNQCPAGFICIDGTCVSGENGWGGGTPPESLIRCEDSIDLFDGIGANTSCPEGMKCFNGYCVSESDLLECVDDNICPSGTICISGLCVSDGNIFDEPGPFQGIGGENYVPGASNDFQEPGEFQGINVEGYKLTPGGSGARVIALSLPSSDPVVGKNFFNGTPNQLVVIRPGNLYYFNNPKDDSRVFPSVFVNGYEAQPIPVVDRATGEMVAVLTAAAAFDPNAPSAPVTLIPDSSTTGITTDDPSYDIVLGGFHIANTGFDYVNPKIEILDRDKDTTENAKAELVVKDGRIVDYEIINNGTQFRRIPKVRITDDNGYGADLYPIMSVIENDKAKPLPTPIQKVFCPSNQINII